MPLQWTHAIGHSLRPVIVVALALTTSACTSGPSAFGPLRFDATMSRATIPSGETATLTIRLENVTAHPVEVAFPDGCQMLPFIVERPAGETVYPGGGTWFCTLALTTLHLAPGGSVVRDIVVRAGTPAVSDQVTLPAGQYSAYATLGHAHSGVVVRWAGQEQELPESARTTRRRDFTVQ